DALRLHALDAGDPGTDVRAGSEVHRVLRAARAGTRGLGRRGRLGERPVARRRPGHRGLAETDTTAGRGVRTLTTRADGQPRATRRTPGRTASTRTPRSGSDRYHGGPGRP